MMRAGIGLDPRLGLSANQTLSEMLADGGGGDGGPDRNRTGDLRRVRPTFKPSLGFLTS